MEEYTDRLLNESSPFIPSGRLLYNFDGGAGPFNPRTLFHLRLRITLMRDYHPSTPLIVAWGLACRDAT